MENTTWVPGTVITSSWLKEVNSRTYIDSVSMSSYDVDTTGTTSCTTEFREALVFGSGKVIKFPSGTYLLQFSEVNGFSIPSGTTIEGDGKHTTELRLSPDSSTYRNLFSVGSNVTFKNIKITCVIPTGGTVSLFVGDHTGMTLSNCYLDGGMTNVGSTLSHSSFGINFATTGTVSDIFVENCDITRFRLFFLKTNTSTSTQQRITVSNCDFFSNIGEDCSFNSPATGAVMDDIQIYACNFRDSQATSASLVGLYVAFASCTNWRVGLCNFTGNITDAVHIEEASYRGVVTSNTFYVSGNGIVIQDNNIGGTAYMPTDITVTGNTITKSGTAKSASSYGIWLVNDATSEVPAKRVVIANNTCANFFCGFQTGASGDDATSITNNISYNCARGFGLMSFITSVADNISSSCDIGVVCDTSTMLVRHKFIECTIAVDAVNRPAHVIDPMFLWSEFSVTGGTTVNKPTFTLGANDRVYGEWAVSAFCDAPADNANRRNLTIWDGATYTNTSRIAIEPGAIALTVNNTGAVLNIGVFAGATRTNVRLATYLSGSVVVNT